MFSFVNLGSYGRLGNQMFQYAALFSLAKKYNVNFLIPDVRISDYKKYELLQAFKNLSAEIITLDNHKFRLIKQRYYEKSFSYDNNFLSTKLFTDLYGYYQSEKYFSLFKEELKKEFCFSNEVINECKLKINKYKENKFLLCAIHVRRGDYTNLQDYHTNLSIKQYYQSGINLILEKNKDTKFIIFSDDIEWCKEIELFKEKCIFPQMKNHFEDLCMMTQCDYHIIANSSFSWWGSYLSSSKFTIAPKNWFGPKLKTVNDTKDLYIKDWILI